MSLLTTITAFVRQYHYFHGTLHALERASERQLADMGVERADLAGLAWAEAERRVALEAQTARAAVSEVRGRQPRAQLCRPALSWRC